MAIYDFEMTVTGYVEGTEEIGVRLSFDSGFTTVGGFGFVSVPGDPVSVLASGISADPAAEVWLTFTCSFGDGDIIDVKTIGPYVAGDIGLEQPET